MTDAEIAIVGKLADLCREKGIKSLDVGGCKMEMGPPAEAALPEKPSQDPEMCRCKHPVYAHDGAGLCVHGCEAERCVEPKMLEAEGKT